MKSSIRISNYVAKLETNVFPVGNVMVRGIMGYMIAGSFSVSLQLTNNCVSPVFKIADTENPWVLIGKYKRPCCVLVLLSSD